MKIAVAGAGAFGTGLAIALAANGTVTLWARDDAAAEKMHRTRENSARLPGHRMPNTVMVTSDQRHRSGHFARTRRPDRNPRSHCDRSDANRAELCR